MASISKTKPCRANLRSILTPFTKPHTHHYQHYWLTLSSLHSLWGYLKIQQLHGNWMAMMHPHSHIVASNYQLQPLHGNWMAMMHPHCHIVASNDQCQQLHGNWIAMMHSLCHIVACNDQCGNFCGNWYSFWQCQTVIAKMLPCHCWYIHCWRWQNSQQWNIRHCWQLNANDTPNGNHVQMVLKWPNPNNN